MEKLLNNIIRNVKKVINKKYFLIVVIFTLIVSVLGFTYGYISLESDWKLAEQLKIKNLYYSITINGTSTNVISVPASSGTTYYDVKITSLNDINTRYLLTYKSSVSDVWVRISSKSTNSYEGVIGLYSTGTNSEKEKTVRIAVTNNTTSAATVILDVTGGYTWNLESTIAATHDYKRIYDVVKEVTIAQGSRFADDLLKIMNCTPTTTAPCYMKNNPNNYLTYGGKRWRIVGVYYVNGQKLTKIVLNEPLTELTAFSNLATKTSAFESTLSDTSLIESITNITKADYDAIGGVDSYLYTKPNKDYWLSTSYYVGTSRGAVNKSSSATAYIRPAIFLKENIVNSNRSGTDGRYGRPYTVVAPYVVTFNNQGGSPATEYLYLAPGESLINRTIPTKSNGAIFMGYYTAVGGAGTKYYNDNGSVAVSSISGNLTLNAYWNFRLTYSCNGGPGTAPATAYVKENAVVNLSNKPCGRIITAGTNGAVKYQTGWSTSSSGGTVINSSSYTVTSNLNLYSAWTNVFTYTGTKNVIKDSNTNWRVEFTGSGTLTMNLADNVDLHAVGGGGAGGGCINKNGSGGGGGGGYTAYLLNQSVAVGTYTITVGAGGTGVVPTAVGGRGATGGASSFGTLLTANGGQGGGNERSGSKGGHGGAGGSGGSGGVYQHGIPKIGGSNGSNGNTSTAYLPGDPGAGQGTTTRDFGETAGTLRSGGGTGGTGYKSDNASSYPTTSAAGGGGFGANTSSGHAGYNGNQDKNGNITCANCGGGGGGGGCGSSDTDRKGGSGGIGIVIMRNKR